MSSPKQLVVRFEVGAENRFSPDYGPFEWVQLTYATLRLPPDGEEFASYDSTKGEWIINDKPDEWWTDIIISVME